MFKFIENLADNPFVLGTVEGVSTELTKGLQNSLDKTDQRLERSAERLSKQRRENRKDLREQDRQISDILDQISGFIDKDKLPEGVSVYDAAASIFANQAGGSITRGTTLINALTESELKGRSPGMVLDKVVSTNMSPSDVRKQFLTFPDVTPVDDVMGAGFLKKVNLKDDILAATDEPPLPARPTDVVDFGEARFDLSKTSQAFAAGQQEELTDLQIQQAKITIAMDKKKIADMGGLDLTSQRYYLKNTLKSEGRLKGFETDEAGNIIFKTTGKQFEDSQDAFAEALRKATNYFKDTGTLATTSGRNSLLGFVSENSAFARSSGKAAIKDGNFDGSQMEIGRIYSYKVGGQNMNGFWTGSEMITISGM
tara:strand:+ start:533 stop:1639 length:1107 start_codon:yes stop_codon:yes gene_type:complete